MIRKYTLYQVFGLISGIAMLFLSSSLVLAFQDGLRVPEFFLNVPKGHFAGVSSPMPSLAEARKAAISDVIRQILRSISVEYKHHYVDRVSGNVRGQGLKRLVLYKPSASGGGPGKVLPFLRKIK